MRTRQPQFGHVAPQTYYQPPRDMNLPLTEFYLSKHSELRSPSYEREKSPKLENFSLAKHGARDTANHNPFSTQLERDSIVAGDILRKRREGREYVPAYQASQ